MNGSAVICFHPPLGAQITGGGGGVPSGPPVLWRPDINTNTELAAWPTVGMAVNTRLDALYPDGLRSYVLLAGSLTHSLQRLQKRE